MIGDRGFVGSLSGFQILFGVRPLADHGDAPVDLDFGILGDGLSFRDIRLRGCQRRICSLNARQRLLDDGLAVGYGSPRRIEVRLCLIDLSLEGCGIDPRDQLAFRHFGVVIGEQGQNDARHLRAHLHGYHRVRGAGGGDGDANVAMFDSRGAVLNSGLSPDHGPCPQPYGHASHGGNDENGFPLHIYLVPYFTILFSVFQAAPWQSASLDMNGGAAATYSWMPAPLLSQTAPRAVRRPLPACSARVVRVIPVSPSRRSVARTVPQAARWDLRYSCP